MRRPTAHRFSPSVLLLSASVLTGCYEGVQLDPTADSDGVDEGGDSTGDEPDGDASEAFECDPSAVPVGSPMRRLTKAQYDNTVRDLLRWALPAEGDAVADVVAELVAAVPDDVQVAPEGLEHGGFTRLDQSVHQEHINATYAVGRAIATALTDDPARLSVVAGACATDADLDNDAACVDDFVHRFGERALRRPLTDAEATFYHEVFDGDGATEGTEPEAFADVISVMLASPQFFYLIEHGDEPVEGQPGVYRLSAFELASRLSYHLWQTMPDDALWSAARSGELLTDEGYAAQVDRLFADPRARTSMARFYRQWLWLDDLPAMDALVGDPRFDAFLGDFAPEPDTHEHMVDETLEMLAYYTFDTPGTLADVMLTERSFARHDDVAELYDAPVWEAGEPPALPPGERVGLLSRAALTATGTANTRPIMKGVFARTALLCQSIPPPPDNVNAVPPAPSAGQSTREVVEQLTEQAGSSCAGCHSTIINPLGFVSENYDALGRVRDQQVIFDDEGEVSGARPIDTRTVPQIVPGDETPAAGVADAAQQMLDSGLVQACFARQVLRYTHGRAEDTRRDGCALQDLSAQLEADAPLAEVLRSIAMDPQFRQRVIED